MEEPKVVWNSEKRASKQGFSGQSWTDGELVVLPEELLGKKTWKAA